MSDHRSPPPEPAACLERRRPSSQKGGTIIAEDVTDPETHRRRLCDPDGYRPRECPSCQYDVLHVHAYRERILVADPVVPVVTVVVYVCIGCGGTWRILPRFVARHLWRSWRTVEASTIASPPPASQPKVAERTVRRWRERLASAARMLLQILATSGSAWLEAIAQALGLDATRAELVGHCRSVLAPEMASSVSYLAALIHRLEPGVRLM